MKNRFLPAEYGTDYRTTHDEKQGETYRNEISQEIDNSGEFLLLSDIFCDMIASIIVNKGHKSHEENKMASKEASLTS